MYTRGYREIYTTRGYSLSNHPGYTLHPTIPVPVCASSPAQSEVPDEEALGSEKRKPLGESLSEPYFSQRCEQRARRMRRVVPLLREGRMERLDSFRVNLPISPMVRYLCAMWCVHPSIRSLPNVHHPMLAFLTVLCRSEGSLGLYPGLPPSDHSC